MKEFEGNKLKSTFAADLFEEDAVQQLKELDGKERKSTFAADLFEEDAV